MRSHLIEPSTDQILRFCALAPVERVFLEDVARRAQGRFAALPGPDRELTALCHLGSNIVPSGSGCEAFAALAAKSGARMLIGEAGAVSDLWEAARRKMPRARLDRPGQPVYVITDPPRRATRDCGRPRWATSTCSFPRVRLPTTRSSRSTLCDETRKGSAGAPEHRSRRGARGCGWRTA